MEKINFFERRALRAGLGLVLGTAILASCANYSGDGNEFEVSGVVTDVGDESIKAEVYSIDEANGDADGWFDDLEGHRFHDNCNCHGAWTGKKQYGHVVDMSGVRIDISDVEEGNCMEFRGKIRSHQEGKTHNDRPVYDIAQVIDC